jgi:transposase
MKGTRQGFVQQRTATINRIRGLLSEFGIVLPLKAATVRMQAMRQLEELPGWANTVVGDLLSEVHRLDERIAQYDRHIEQIAKVSAPARQLMQLPGVGATTATALMAMIGRGHEFKCGRQLSAWLGLVPGQHSSGGKQRLRPNAIPLRKAVRVVLARQARPTAPTVATPRITAAPQSMSSNVGVDRHAAALRRETYALAHGSRRNAAACPRRTTC